MYGIKHNWADIKNDDGDVIFHELLSVDLATNRQAKYTLSALKAKTAKINLFELSKMRNSRMLRNRNYSRKV